MKQSLIIGGSAALLLTLAGCIHVAEGDYSDQDEIAANTEMALQVCGGPGTIAEVSEDGFECKEDDE
ncbi:MAG: hypothetical protein Hens3KO_04680 [Henriciella sp.]